MMIDGRVIGVNEPPYIIAEISANHNGDINQAIRIIEAAKEVGADAVKLQTYTPDTITLNATTSDFVIEGGLWHGRTLYDLYSEAHTPWDWHGVLFDRARALGITIFSSPFDATAVDHLEKLGTPAYKVASFEVIDLPLIRYIASTGKPMIISTGMANLEEITEAIQAARDGGCDDLVLLHCVSGYPAPAEDYNLATLTDMARRFQVPVGLSDHTLDNTTAIASVALGAVILEKHFTLDRKGGGPDDSFSLEPDGFRQLCEGANIAWNSIGSIDYGRKSSEEGNVKFRRSLYFVENLDAGEVITKDAIRSVRPGYGVPPKNFDRVVGCKVTSAVVANTPVNWNLIDQGV